MKACRPVIMAGYTKVEHDTLCAFLKESFVGDRFGRGPIRRSTIQRKDGRGGEI